MKLVIVGGASAYTPDIVDGLLRERDLFQGWRLILFDIDQERLAIIARLSRRMVEAARAEITVEGTTDRTHALEGARFVLNQPRTGGLGARETDERIALTHGVIGQETLGAGGISFALRSIPLVLDLLAEMERVAPGAWMINYANPAGMVTEAVLRRRPGARFIGLCDMPTGIEWTLGRLLRRDPHRIALDYQGINHGGWAPRVLLDGVDILPKLRRWTGWVPPVVIPALGEEGGAFRLFRRHGIIPDPYLRYYYFQEQMLRWQLRQGRTRAAQVMERLPRLYAHYEAASQMEAPALREHRGHASHSDLAAQVISTIAGGRRSRFVIQQKNGGAVAGLPPDQAAQFPALIGPDGWERIPVEPLPEPLLPLIRQVKESEALAVEGALLGDRIKVIEAMTLNPLIGQRSVAERLTDAYLAAHKAYLPQFYA